MGEGLLKGAASTFAKAQVALAKFAITYPAWGNRLKVAGCLAVRVPRSGAIGRLM